MCCVFILGAVWCAVFFSSILFCSLPFSEIIIGFQLLPFYSYDERKKINLLQQQVIRDSMSQHHLSLLKSKMVLEDLYTSYTLLTSSKEVINHTALLRESRTPPKRCPNGFYDRWHAIWIDKCEHFPPLFPSSDEHVWREAVEMRVERIRKP